MSRILGVKFRDFGQIYYFDSGPYVVSEGDEVIVETEQGRGLATVAVIREELPESAEQDKVKTIFRLANDEDVQAVKENAGLSKQAFVFCRDRIKERGLEMKLVDVEVFFDRSKMIFYFTAPGRVDFRNLVKDLVREYRTRIELRQIGVRHETQMIGAVGNCGQLCCCRRFMRKFDPVTIKMAKEQNLFLNPTKISGICGRLLCCLNFEQHNYEKFQKKCPRIGKKYDTELGTVKVLRSNFFRDSLTLLVEGREEREITVDEWAEISSRPPAREGGADKPEASGPRRKGQGRPQEQAQESAQGEHKPRKEPKAEDKDGRSREADQNGGPRKKGRKGARRAKPKSRGSNRRRGSRKKGPKSGKEGGGS